MISEIEKQEAIDIINSVLLTIPEEEAEVLIMRNVHGMKLREISSLFNWSIFRVRLALNRAERKLRHPTRIYKLREAAEVIFS